MSEVSLCILRVEESKTSDQVDESLSESFNKSINIRGQRQLKELEIENYTTKNMDLDDGFTKVEKKSQKNLNESKVEKSEAEVDLGTIPFVAGNPFVETVRGIIHLFKENETTDFESAALRSQTVCILSVPSFMTCRDFLGYIAACYEDIQHVRIIRGNSQNQYMTLITFRTARGVRDFYATFNGTPYNSMEPQYVCNMVFVSKVETLSDEEEGYLPPVSHTELPTCPVCLERMDESVDGVLTIMCNHAFHCRCLAKCLDTSCPVCRYVQTPEPEENCCFECQEQTDSLWICLICGHIGCGRYIQGHAYKHFQETNHCYAMQLGNNSVWDYVGDNFVHRLLQDKVDGKLVESKSSDEEAAKMEEYQLEFVSLMTAQLESQRLYYEDKLDKKEASFSKELSFQQKRLVSLSEELQECLQLLSSSKKKSPPKLRKLKTPEDIAKRMEELKKEKQILQLNIKAGVKEEEMASTSRDFQAENSELLKTVESLTKKNRTLESKLECLKGQLVVAYRNLSEEKEMTRQMALNAGTRESEHSKLLAAAESFKAEKEMELLELKEQVRDMMFYLDAQRAVTSSELASEIQEGSIEVAPPPNPPRHRKKKK